MSIRKVFKSVPQRMEALSGLHDGRCECGKLIFKDRPTASMYIWNLPAGTNAVRAYECDKVPGNWHTTKHRHNEEVAAEMTIQNQTLTKEIIQYMEKRHKRDGVYKISTKMVIDGLPHYNKTNVSVQISKMKRFKLITNLDEKVPDQKGATYFALTSVLDEVTKPSKKEEVSKEMSKITSVPAQPNKPTPTVANPFEEVKKQLTELNNRLNGLAQGYAGLVSRGVPDYSPLISSLEKRVAFESENLRKDLGGDLSRVVSTNIENQSKALLNVFMEKIEDIRTSSNTTLVGVHDSILKAIEVSNGSPVSTANESDDYKRGLMDGIKMAIEMGLKLGGN